MRFGDILVVCVVGVMLLVAECLNAVAAAWAIVCDLVHEDYLAARTRVAVAVGGGLVVPYGRPVDGPREGWADDDNDPLPYCLTDAGNRLDRADDRPLLEMPDPWESDYVLNAPSTTPDRTAERLDELVWERLSADFPVFRPVTPATSYGASMGQLGQCGRPAAPVAGLDWTRLDAAEEIQGRQPIPASDPDVDTAWAEQAVVMPMPVANQRTKKPVDPEKWRKANAVGGQTVYVRQLGQYIAIVWQEERRSATRKTRVWVWRIVTELSSWDGGYELPLVLESESFDDAPTLSAAKAAVDRKRFGPVSAPQ